MEIKSTTEDPIQLHDNQQFISKNDVEPGARHVPAYVVEGPDNYVIGIESNTPLAPEFRDEDGNKLDPSTQILLQKADPQGNPLGNAIVFQHNLDAFDYEKMRSDKRFYRHTDKSLLLDEREYLYVYAHIPESADKGLSAEKSRLTIGDNATSTGKAVYIRQKDSLSEVQSDAVNGASSNGNGNGNGNGDY